MLGLRLLEGVFIEKGLALCVFDLWDIWGGISLGVVEGVFCLFFISFF